MSNPVALATLFDKPTPVGEQPAKAAALLHAKLARTPEAAEAEEDAGPIAPYQAKPISGAISRNYTPALDVLEHCDLDQQVCQGLAAVLQHNNSPQDVEERINDIINGYKRKLADRSQHHMGYPYNLDFEYGPLEGLQSFMINNLGDPFIESNYGVHSREFEVRCCCCTTREAVDNTVFNAILQHTDWRAQLVCQALGN